ncbi:MAG: bifunctional folylpolyglutamate synthase/dihydrofolate synthase [Planctomycetaceae bacterium]
MWEPFRTYEQALEFLFGRINYERVEPGSYSRREFKLDRMRRLLARLGDPHLRIPAVHIAGTKGKGSTAAMTAAMLTAAGRRVGLFTSPHLTAFEERMTVDGRMPGRETFIELVNEVRPVAVGLEAESPRRAPTYFETAAALAWLYFVRERVELAVLEVGLGGRLDATNLCRPEVTIITSISRDHTALLGETLAEIAAEKAGIIKRGVPVVSGVAQPEPDAVIERIALGRRAPLYRLGREIHALHHDDTPRGGVADIETPWSQWPAVAVPLPGEHQARNAALALTAVELLSQRGWPVPREAAAAGLERLTWPIRVESLCERPVVVVDAAHNDGSVEALLATLRRRYGRRRALLVFATSRDKDARGMLARLAPEFEAIVLTRYLGNPRAVPVEQLAQIAREAADRPATCAATPAEAWSQARQWAGPEDLICATGSFFLAAEMRELIIGGPANRVLRRAAGVSPLITREEPAG